MADMMRRLASAIHYADGDRRADAALNVFIQAVEDKAQALEREGDDISADVLDDFAAELKATYAA